MGGKVVSALALRDERTQLDVLGDHLLRTHVGEVLAESLHHTVVGDLRRVRDIGEDRVLHISVYRFQDSLLQLSTQHLALLVDVLVISPTEIDAFEDARGIRLRIDDGLQEELSVLPHDQRLTRLQLLHLVARQIEGGLKHRTLARHSDEFIVPVEEGGADTPRVTHGEHLTATRQTADHIASVEVRHGGGQHVADVHMRVHIVGDLRIDPTRLLRLTVEALHLTVQAMAHQLQHDVRVAVDARVLSLLRQELEDVVDVRHVEVTADAKVLRPPVVAAQERVHIAQAPFACGTITKMTHQQLALKRWCA